MCTQTHLIPRCNKPSSAYHRGKALLWLCWLGWGIFFLFLLDTTQTHNTAWGQTSTSALQAQQGKELFVNQGCLACHSLDGTARLGPSMFNLYGQSVRLQRGTTVVRDVSYFRKQLLSPESQRVAGYPPVMPSYKGRLDETQIQALITYIRTLSRVGVSIPVPSSKTPASGVGLSGTATRSYPPHHASPRTPAPVQVSSPSPAWIKQPTRQILALGKHYYHVHCAFCHGVGGNGNAPGGRGHGYTVQNFAQGNFLYGTHPQAMYNIITHGSPRTQLMPAWKHIHPSIRWSLVAYLRNLGTPTKQ